MLLAPPGGTCGRSLKIILGDSCLIFVVNWRFRGKIKEVIKFVSGEGFYRPNDEFLIDVALALPHPVDLAY